MELTCILFIGIFRQIGTSRFCCKHVRFTLFEHKSTKNVLN